MCAVRSPPLLSLAMSKCGSHHGCFAPEARMSESHPDWRTHGVRVIKGDQLDPNTAQTPGMNRAAAINCARVGAQKLWAGTVTIHPNAKTGAASSRRARERDLCGARQGAHALGRAARVSWPKPRPAISSSCRLTCRTRRSTLRPTRRSNACWCAATTRRSSSTSTSTPVEQPEAVYWVDPVHAAPHP